MRKVLWQFGISIYFLFVKHSSERWKGQYFEQIRNGKKWLIKLNQTVNLQTFS